MILSRSLLPSVVVTALILAAVLLVFASGLVPAPFGFPVPAPSPSPAALDLVAPAMVAPADAELLTATLNDAAATLDAELPAR